MTTSLPFELITAFDKLQEKFGEVRGAELILDWFDLTEDPKDVRSWEKSFKGLKTGLRYPTISPVYKLYKETTGMYKSHPAVYHINELLDFIGNRENIVPKKANLIKILQVNEKTFAKHVKTFFNSQPEHKLGMPVYQFEKEITSYGDYVGDETFTFVLTDNGILNMSYNTEMSLRALQTKVAEHANESSSEDLEELIEETLKLESE